MAAGVARSIVVLGFLEPEGKRPCYRDRMELTEKQFEDCVKREVLLIIEKSVRDHLNFLVDLSVKKWLAEIVELQVSECIGKAIGKHVTAFLRKNQ